MTQPKTSLYWRDIILTLITSGILVVAFATFMKIGEYKANFETITQSVKDLKSTIENNATENNKEHERMKNAIILISHKPIQ